MSPKNKSRLKGLAVALGAAGVSAVAFTYAFKQVLQHPRSSEAVSDPVTEVQHYVPMPDSTRKATVLLEAASSSEGTTAKVQVLTVSEQCDSTALRAPAAGSGHYLVATPGQDEVRMTRLYCLEVSATATPFALPSPGPFLLTIDGRELSVSQRETVGIALNAPDGPWMLTATALRAAGRGTLAINVSRSTGPWSVQVPSGSKPLSVGVLLHEHEVADWRAVFTRGPGEIFVEDGTLPDDEFDVPPDTEIQEDADYAPLS